MILSSMVIGFSEEQGRDRSKKNSFQERRKTVGLTNVGLLARIHKQKRTYVLGGRKGRFCEGKARVGRDLQLFFS